MIIKGLKPGDTFTDGKLLYKVDFVYESGNYRSSLVGLASEDEKPKKAVVDEVKEANYADIPYSELKKLAKEQGISAKGSKEELIDRLKGV